MIFSDVRHAANQSYNYGNGSAIDGYFPRTGDSLAHLERYAPIMRSWCTIDDLICAANQSTYDEASHLDYFNLYSDEAASFIRSVASLSQSSSFTSAIPVTSLSGTVQDYATVGTTTPTGTVTSWSSTVIPCYATTVTSSSSLAATSISSSAETSAATFAGVSITASMTSSPGVQSSTGEPAASTTASSGGHAVVSQYSTLVFALVVSMMMYV